MLYQSPGVYTREISLDQNVAAASTSIGVCVGSSERGPVNQRVLVTSLKNFKEVFGAPSSFSTYCSVEFLKESNAFYYTRVADSALIGGSFVNDGIDDAVSTNIGTADGVETAFAGTVGEEVVPGSVVVKNAADDVAVDNGQGLIIGSGVTGTINYETGAVSVSFDNPPADTNPIAVEASNFVLNKTAAFESGVGNSLEVNFDNSIDALFAVIAANPGKWNDNLKYSISDIDTEENTFSINVYETKNNIDYLLETHEVSRETKLDGFSRQLFIEDKVSSSSNLIRVINNPNIAAEKIPAITGTVSLVGGSDGETVGDAEVVAGWDLYSNRDVVGVNILINGGYSTPAVQAKMIEVAEAREDCIAILDVPSEVQGTNDLLSWRVGDGKFNTSYAAAYSPDVTIYDDTSDRKIVIPPSGHVAGVYARSDRLANAFAAPAGVTRGKISALEISWSYDQGSRDALYAKGINVIRNLPDAGFVVWGQKTLQSKSSSTNRVMSRRLINFIKSSVSKSLLDVDFDNNTPFNRLKVSQSIDSFMRTVLSQNGVYAYQVVCDETNNTNEVIDNYQMNADVYIQPQKAAEAIQLQVVVTKTGASFAEFIATGGNF